jgi:hypothetical protein
VIKALKKEDMREYVNKAYLLSHKRVPIWVEMDEMRSFYQDKEHHIWLWRAFDHYTGEVVACWFGSVDKLLELLEPLTMS